MSWGFSNRQWSPRHLNGTCLPISILEMLQKKNTSKQTDKLTAQQQKRWSTSDNNTKQLFGTERFLIMPSFLILDWKVLSSLVLVRQVATAPWIDPKESQRGKYRIFPLLNTEQGIERWSDRKSHRRCSKSSWHEAFLPQHTFLVAHCSCLSHLCFKSAGTYLRVQASLLEHADTTIKGNIPVCNLREILSQDCTAAVTGIAGILLIVYRQTTQIVCWATGNWSPSKGQRANTYKA